MLQTSVAPEGSSDVNQDSCTSSSEDGPILQNVLEHGNKDLRQSRFHEACMERECDSSQDEAPGKITQRLHACAIATRAPASEGACTNVCDAFSSDY